MKIKNTIPFILPFLFLFFSTKNIIAKYELPERVTDILSEKSIPGKNATADLGLELSVNNVNAQVGATVIFTVEVTNYGPANATGVQVKDKLPGGYTYIISATITGSYSSNTGVWAIGALANGRSVILTITAIVNPAGDYMNLAEVTASDQDDPDSKPGDGVDTDKDKFVVDDPGDDDDGDGQDVKPSIKGSGSESGGGTGGNNNSGGNGNDVNLEGSDSSATYIPPTGITAFLKDHKGRTQTYYFDRKTVAMRVEFDKKDKQKPMYFDNKGYVYTAGKKQGYVKVPFEKLKKLMAFPTIVSNGVLPPIDFPDGSITYYGMDVSPKRFPILEWAFVYKIKHFEGNPDFNKENLECRGQLNCVKYTLIAGKDAGSYVLFDSKERLAEIFSIDSGNAVYSYEDNTVLLPNAQEMPFF